MVLLIPSVSQLSLCVCQSHPGWMWAHAESSHLITFIQAPVWPLFHALAMHTWLSLRADGSFLKVYSRPNKPLLLCQTGVEPPLLACAIRCTCSETKQQKRRLHGSSAVTNKSHFCRMQCTLVLTLVRWKSAPSSICETSCSSMWKGQTNWNYTDFTNFPFSDGAACSGSLANVLSFPYML